MAQKLIIAVTADATTAATAMPLSPHLPAKNNSAEPERHSANKGAGEAWREHGADFELNACGLTDMEDGERGHDDSERPRSASPPRLKHEIDNFRRDEERVRRKEKERVEPDKRRQELLKQLLAVLPRRKHRNEN